MARRKCCRDGLASAKLHPGAVALHQAGTACLNRINLCFCEGKSWPCVGDETWDCLLTKGHDGAHAQLVGKAETRHESVCWNTGDERTTPTDLRRT